MIVEIKDYVRGVVEKVTPIKAKRIIYAQEDNRFYANSYFASILTGQAKPKKQFNIDCIEKQPVKTIKHIRKFTFDQPIKVLLAGKTEAEVDQWVFDFFLELDSNIVRQNQKIDIEPVSVQYTDSDSPLRGQYLALIELRFGYGVFTIEELPDVINQTMNITMR